MRMKRVDIRLGWVGLLLHSPPAIVVPVPHSWARNTREFCFHDVFIFSSCLDGQLYRTVPIDTRMPPTIIPLFQPLPKYETLIIRLTALRAVKKRLVCTEEDV